MVVPAAGGSPPAAGSDASDCRPPAQAWHLMSAPPLFWIAPHVRACRCSEQVILLDLQRNRYHGVGGTAASALEGVIGGWPCGATRTAAPSPRHAIAVLVAPLVDLGLLVQSPVASSPQEPLPTASESWPPCDEPGAGDLSATRLCRLLLHAASAAWDLRQRSFATIADRLTASRARHVQRSAPARIDAWRDTVDAFVRLRPLVLSTRGRCLHESLTLARLLVAEDTVARWVIGVQALPFAAHAWVQRGNVVLGDDHERIRGFVPILTV